jgi:hypothetical protein
MKRSRLPRKDESPVVTAAQPRRAPLITRQGLEAGGRAGARLVGGKQRPTSGSTGAAEAQFSSFYQGRSAARST